MFVALGENLSQDSPEEHSQQQRETEIWETYWRNWGSQLEKPSVLILDYPKVRGHRVLTWLSQSLQALVLMNSVAQCSYPDPGPENLGRPASGVNSGGRRPDSPESWLSKADERRCS